MKKLIVLLTFCLTLMAAAGTLAADKQATTDKGMDWEISMQQKPTAEEAEAARWSILVENDFGIYAYDMDSLVYTDVKDGVAGKNNVAVEVKTVFTNKDVLKKLQKDYASKLEKKEKALYCKMQMEFQLREKTYRVNGMEVYSDKDRLLETKPVNRQFTAVPEGSFAEAMYEICQKAAAEPEK